MITPPTIRLYRRGDEAGLITLFREVFGTERSLAEWNWKYRGYNQGEEPLIAIAQVHDRIVAMFPSIRMKVRVRGRLETVVQGVDNAVLPSYRNAMIQKRVYNCFIDEARKTSMFLFGFPGKRHFDLGLKALHYTDLGCLELFECKNTDVLSLGSLDGDLSCKELRSFEEEISAISNLADEVASRFPLTVYREPSYLKHRYDSNPTKKFRIASVHSGDVLRGYAVLHLNEAKEGVFYDLVGADDATVAHSLIQYGTRILKESGATTIKCWYRGLSTYRKALLRRGYAISDTENFRPAMRYLGEEFERTVTENPSSWFMTLGDSDL